MIETKEQYENWVSTDASRGYLPYMPISDLVETIEALRNLARAADTHLDATHIIERRAELQRTLDALPRWLLDAEEK